jgi:putative RNA ligase
MQLKDYLSIDELNDCIENKLVRVAKHDTLPLKLYTYTEHAQFDGSWPDAARKCRGLVVEGTGEIIAWCMPKFFNYGEHEHFQVDESDRGKPYAKPLPVGEDFEIFCKMDGSMGTVFFYDDRWHVASKGSFHSEQAEWATEHLNSKLWTYGDEYEAPEYKGVLNSQKTYVCEIIYPENRIVVNYGSLEDLVLLTVYDNRTGEECFTEERKLEWGWVGSVVPRYEPYSLTVDELQHLASENILLDEDNGDREVSGDAMEGYVIRYASGIRCKVKLTDYLRLHKIVTNCTDRSVWEALKDRGQDGLEYFLADVPDEFHDWVQVVSADIINHADSVIDFAHRDFETIVSQVGTDNRKAFAELAKKSVYAPALFLLLDGKIEKFKEWVWDQVKPAATRSFFKGEA